MTKPQLGSLTNFNSSANTVTSETTNKDTNLFHLGIPLTTISENISLRTPFVIISISGIFEGTESEINAFVTEINNSSTVNQSEKTYTNSLDIDTDVKINNFTYVTAPNTTRTEYTLEFYNETI